jgi:hypothetical protein
MATRKRTSLASPGAIAVAVWSWSAVAAGAITSLTLQILLIMPGFGIGLFSIDGSTVADAPIGGSWTAFGWWAVSALAATFAAGWVVGMMAPAYRPAHALAAWAVTTILVIGIAVFTVGGTPTASSAGSIPQAETSAEPGTTGEGPFALDHGQPEQTPRGLSGGTLAGSLVLLLGAGATYAGTRAASALARLNAMS